jgi:hypothetical protein
MFDYRQKIKNFRFHACIVMIPLCLQLRALFSLNVFGNLLEPNTRKQMPLGAKPAENPRSVIHKHCSMKNLRIREENPSAWYSNNARQPVITPNALSQSIK